MQWSLPDHNHNNAMHRRHSHLEHLNYNISWWTIRRLRGHHKETQTDVVWTCLPFIRSGQNHLARHSGREKKDKADRRRGGKTTPGNGMAAWSSPSPGGQRKMKETGCKVICGTPTTPAVKGQMRWDENYDNVVPTDAIVVNGTKGSIRQTEVFANTGKRRSRVKSHQLKVVVIPDLQQRRTLKNFRALYQQDILK